MYRVLVIGCGKIGAQYDFDNSELHTHVKTWSSKTNINLSVYDIDQKLMQSIVKKYNCNYVNEISIKTLANYDIVSLCTPTNTHYTILKKLLLAKVKTIICEKPISNNRDELISLKKIYDNSDTKIIVNFIRRFQPDYLELKKKVKEIKEDITNISISYQRGFMNNCSHAFDLIEFLLDSSLDLQEIKLHNICCDEFNKDPTLSLMATWGKINLNIFGLSKVNFSLFEINIFYKSQKISIKNSGNQITFYKSQNKTNFYGPLYVNYVLNEGNSLKNYMLPVVNYALSITGNPSLADNFSNSLKLNIKMLDYLKKINL